MKRIILLLSLFSSFFCGGTNAQKIGEPLKILVAYYSNSGNTHTLAQQIQKATNADIFRIEVKTPYPSDYQGLLNKAKEEITNNEKPALKTILQNLAQYDIIFIGSPNWWGTIAPPVTSFLSKGNFSGKTIVTFVTYGGSGMAKCESDVKKLCPGAKILDGLAINGSHVQNATPRIQKWLNEIGVIQ